MWTSSLYMSTMGLFSPHSRGGSRIDLSPELSLVNTSAPLVGGCQQSLHTDWVAIGRGLSSGDNWLSIRDRDNNVRVSRKSVNHYLSVRWPRLHSLALRLCFSPPPPSCSFTFPQHFPPLLPLMVFTVCAASVLFLPTTFSEERSPPFTASRQLSERSPVFLKVSRRQQVIVATHVLLCLKGHTVSATVPRLDTVTHVHG